ncbi:strychnine-10-hydroxylase-like [Silene latifolia]|uniref:strychnine-10-hydroxylase-like n=1 Tax=Silene latifolia TaxID=37657 RepID=UPI003D77C0B9
MFCLIDFGFSPYGPYWRDIRKITTVKLLSNQRVEMLKNVRISELILAIQDIYENRNKQSVVDMKQWFNDVSLNSSVRLIAGKSLKEIYQGEKYNKVSKALIDFFELAGVFVPADALPFLRWFDIGGYENTMKKVAQEIDQVAEEWLDEHKNRKDSEKRDFMDVLLGLYEAEEERPNTKYGTDTVIKANCMYKTRAKKNARVDINH